MPLIQQRLETQFRLGIQSIETKDTYMPSSLVRITNERTGRTVIGRERKENVCGVCDDLHLLLLVLDGANESEEVDEHNAMRELRVTVQRANITTYTTVNRGNETNGRYQNRKERLTILRSGSKRNEEVDVVFVLLVDMIDERMHILHRGLVEGQNDQLTKKEKKGETQYLL